MHGRVRGHREAELVRALDSLLAALYAAAPGLYPDAVADVEVNGGGAGGVLEPLLIEFNPYHAHGAR